MAILLLHRRVVVETPTGAAAKQLEAQKLAGKLFGQVTRHWMDQILDQIWRQQL